MTLAIVLTINFARLIAASNSVIIEGDGWGCSDTAALASPSAHWFPMASCCSSPVTVSGSTCALTFLTVTNRRQLVSSNTDLMMPA